MEREFWNGVVFLPLISSRLDISRIAYNVQIVLHLDKENKDTNDNPVCSSVVAACYSEISLLASSLRAVSHWNGNIICQFIEKNVV